MHSVWTVQGKTAMESRAVYFLCLLALIQIQSYSTIQIQTGCFPDCHIESHTLVPRNERLFLNVSANFENFPNDCVCRIWAIRASSSVSITIETLTDSLWWYSDCQQTPTIYIYDVWSFYLDLLTSGCQYDNGTIYTTRSSAVVVLKYSPGANYPRFSISYSLKSSGITTTTTATTTTSTVAYSPTTYLFLTDLYGVNYINSLNYPQNNYGQRFATWKLIADSVVTPAMIVLSLETFETDFSPAICHSNITVYDGGSPVGRNHVFCSAWGQSDIWTAYSGEAFVAVSIHPSSYRFSLRYSLQPTVAATTTTTTNAYAVTLCEYEEALYVSPNSWTVLQTPEYPDYYVGNLVCWQKVIAPSYMVVRVLVKDIEMEESYNCRYAGLSLYNIDSWGSSYAIPLASICHSSNRNDDYYSISNSMNITVRLPYAGPRKIQLYLMASDSNGYAASTLPTPSTAAVFMDDTFRYYGNSSLGIVIGGAVAGTLMLLAPVIIALHVCRLRRRRRATLRARLGLPYGPLGRTPSSCSAEHLLPPPYSSVVREGDPPLYTVSEAGPGYLLAMPPPFGGNRLRRREERGEGEVVGPCPAYPPYEEAPPSYEELHPDPAACSPLTSFMPTESPTCIQQCADGTVQASNPLYIADARTDNSTADVGTNAGDHYIAASDSALSVSTGLEASQQQKSEIQQQKP